MKTFKKLSLSKIALFSAVSLGAVAATSIVVVSCSSNDQGFKQYETEAAMREAAGVDQTSPIDKMEISINNGAFKPVSDMTAEEMQAYTDFQNSSQYITSDAPNRAQLITEFNNKSSSFKTKAIFTSQKKAIIFYIVLSPDFANDVDERQEEYMMAKFENL